MLPSYHPYGVQGDDDLGQVLSLITLPSYHPYGDDDLGQAHDTLALTLTLTPTLTLTLTLTWVRCTTRCSP